MKRSGSWILGVVASAGMLGGGWLALRPYVYRETLSVGVLDVGHPRHAADVGRGILLAVGEREERAGGFRVSVACYHWNHVTPPGGFPADSRVYPGQLREDTVALVSTNWGGSGYGIRYAEGVPSLLFLSARDPYSVPDPDALTFLLLPTEEELARAAAGWAKDLGSSRVFLVSRLFRERSRDAVSAFSRIAEDADLPVVGIEAVDAPTPSLPGQILETRPDLVVIASGDAPYGDEWKIIRGLRSMGYRGNLILVEGQPEVSFFNNPGPVVEGTLLVSPFSPGPPEFREAYRTRFGTQPGPNAYSGYRTAEALLEAVETCESRDPVTVASALRRSARGVHPAKLFPSGYVVEKGGIRFVRELGRTP